MPFYAVRVGRAPGIYLNWPDAERQVKGFQNAKFKKFTCKEDAVEFMLIDDPRSLTSEQKLKMFEVKQTTRQEENVSRKRKIDNDQDLSSDEDEKKDMKRSVIKATRKRVKLVTEIDSKLVKSSDPPSSLDKPNKSSETTSQQIENPFLRYWNPNLKFKFNESKGSVFTDGACSNNGYHQAKAGIGVYWGPNHVLNVSEKLDGKQTNNRAEMIAGIVAINQAIHYGLTEITVNTDSKLMIKTMEDYIKKWKLNNWKLKSNNDISNLAEVRFLDYLCSQIKVNWVYVPGHKGIEGNERADKLATGAIAKLA